MCVCGWTCVNRILNKSSTLNTHPHGHTRAHTASKHGKSAHRTLTEIAASSSPRRRAEIATTRNATLNVCFGVSLDGPHKRTRTHAESFSYKRAHLNSAPHSYPIWPELMMSKHAAPLSKVKRTHGIVNRRVIYVVIYHTRRLNKHTHSKSQ